MVKIDNISYSINNKSILNSVSLNIEDGQIVGLIGESGAGKTTLAKIVAGVLEPSSGKIILAKQKQTDVQILFQNSLELINPLRKVSSILEDAEDIVKQKKAVELALKKVGLEKSITSKFGHQLSGGERQRVALARILMVSPKLLILDEPFSAQSPSSQANLVSLFNQLNSDLGITILCVSHDLNIMSSFSDKLGVMKNGELIEFGDATDIVNNPKMSYTKFLFKANKYQLEVDDFV